MLSADTAKTELVLTEGSVDIHSLKNNESLHARSGNTYEVTSVIAAAPSTEEKSREIKSVQGASAGKLNMGVFRYITADKNRSMTPQSQSARERDFMKIQNPSVRSGDMNNEMTPGPRNGMPREGMDRREGPGDGIRPDMDRMRNDIRRPQDGPFNNRMMKGPPPPGFRPR
jgi:hypothetical protein